MKISQFRKLKKIAMNNGEDFHLAAILIRRKRIVRVGTNSTKTHPRFLRTYKNGEENAGLHAEMDVLRFAKPGDTIIVYRFSSKGVLTMAKPCHHCERFIIEAGIKNVIYSDWNGEMIKAGY
jgi:deoxycytidylate deaminase